MYIHDLDSEVDYVRYLPEVGSRITEQANRIAEDEREAMGARDASKRQLKADEQALADMREAARKRRIPALAEQVAQLWSAEDIAEAKRQAKANRLRIDVTDFAAKPSEGLRTAVAWLNKHGKRGHHEFEFPEYAGLPKPVSYKLRPDEVDFIQEQWANTVAES